tara:strand:+ start:29372 stop:30394 length:1023 start_codon:yes stop_codon:yes gene_type:complete
MIENSRPLVTFALLAYNQEEFIAQAIDGAFAQTYSPLEIIISDDCSNDKTFKIIEAKVALYKGPHNIVINKTEFNKCILGHFYDIIDLAKGELLVLAAGDDISHPERVELIAEVWSASSDTCGVISNYDLIDVEGKVTEFNCSPNPRSVLVEDVFGKLGSPDVHGAGSAYDTAFIRNLKRYDNRSYFEDTFMTFMIYLHGRKIEKIELPLVSYRSHENSISNRRVTKVSAASISAEQIKSADYSASKYELFQFLRKHAMQESAVACNERFNVDALDAYVIKLYFRSFWIDTGFWQRVCVLRSQSSDKDFLKWMAPRVFGLRFFVLSKIIYQFSARLLKIG